MYIFDKQSIIFHVIRICTCVHEAGENKIPAFMKQNRLAKNETLIWNFIGSL